ncbi:curli production assembly/transport protein CsgE [Myroides sp. M-43]|uniref:curli production assembly/transport protein CsgE n=1 Tax=Myroides oncorhynchi TaxID=2893756 RepID=UPI001E62FA96|nr:curli production assembly/transport protein CsgE [Myroides oncorhynchi]MCC9044011.1 curli production assembly/transport protein CsgE [Myroides oncorhynchi]
MKPKYIILIILTFFVQNFWAQSINTYIEGIIDAKQEGEFISITALAQNKTDITTSISYKLSVIKNNADSNNQSKTDQTGLKVIESFEKTVLSKTSFNASTADRIIVLLLIYNANEKLIGTGRYVYNDNKDQDSIKQEMSTLLDKQKTISSSKSKEINYKISFKGIVVDETKTKAGKDFYQLYYSNYLVNNINSEHIITVTESITLGNNTKITIKTENKVIYEFFVQTKYDYIKSVSDTALKMTIKYLENLKLNEKRTKIF